MKTAAILFVLLLSGLCLHSHAQPTPAPRTGTIRGTVLNARDRTPVAGATVSVVNDTLRTLTAADGTYAIRGATPGYRMLYIEADGFSAVVTPSVLVTASAPATVDAELDPMLIEVEEIVVSSSPLVATVESPVSLRRVGTEEIDLTPGANRDISKVVQSTPGVLTINTGNRNDVLVRGGGAGENRFFLDGIEIPVLNHFAVQGGSGGYASLVNSELLRSVDFYTGAFPARLPGALSSVMDMEMRSGNPDRPHGKLVVGASDVGLTLDTPLSRNGRTTLLASYRRSYLQMLFDILSLPFLPTYNDYQFKVTSKIGERDEIFALGLGSFDRNRLNLKMKDPAEDRKYILGYMPENDQTSYVSGLGYRHTMPRGEFRATLSRDHLRNLIYKYEDNDDARPRLYDYNTRETNHRFRAEIDLRDLGGFRLTGGVSGGHGAYRNTTSRTVYAGSTPLAERFDSRFSAWRYGLFATLSRYFFGDRFSVLVALRADGMSYSDATRNPFGQLSPRVALSWRVSSRWRINASVARYYQEPSFTTLGYRDSTGVLANRASGLGYSAANHYVAGVEFAPDRGSRLAVEGFYKAYSHLPVSLLDSLPISTGDFADFIVGDVPARSVGKGRAYGVELSYRNIGLANTVLNVSYTLVYSRINRPGRDLAPTGELLPSSWDARHIVNLSAIRKFPRNWSAGVKWYLCGGYPYTPYDAELSSLIGAWDARLRPYPDYARYNALRTGPYHQMDIRIDKVWFFNKWRLGFYIDIQNLYNHSTPGQAILMPETDAAGAYLPDPDRPGHYRMKSVAHDLGGTILPTLGITIEL